VETLTDRRALTQQDLCGLVTGGLPKPDGGSLKGDSYRLKDRGLGRTPAATND